MEFLNFNFTHDIKKKLVTILILILVYNFPAVC